MATAFQLANLFTDPLRSATLREGIHLVYVEESFRRAHMLAMAVGLEPLLEPDCEAIIEQGVSVNHYFPPLQHSSLKRASPQLFYTEVGLGGVAEPDFSVKGVCLVVDEHVHSGQTLWMASEFLKAKGYKTEQVWVAASVRESSSPSNLPYDVRPLKFFGAKLAKAKITLEMDIQQFLPAQIMAYRNGSTALPDALSLPQAIAQYCLIL